MPGSLVNTREGRAGQIFVESVAAALGRSVPVIESPALRIVPVPHDPPACSGDFIFTSRNAIANLRMPFPCIAPAWCVGESTARVAASRGFADRPVSADVARLLRVIAHAATAKELTYVRGVHVARPILDDLGALGHRVTECVVYDQITCAPSKPLLDAVARGEPLIVPIFSPRSTHFLADLPKSAPLRVVAMSDRVKAALPEHLRKSAAVAVSPDVTSMVTATVALFIGNRPDPV